MTRRSLRARLTWLNILLMFFVMVPVGVIAYTHEEAAMGDLLDSRMAQSARSVAALISHRALLPVLVERSHDTRRADPVVTVDRAYANPGVGYQAFDSTGAPIVVTADFEGMPRPSEQDLGFRTLAFGGQSWRMFTMRGTSGTLLRLGERMDVRRDITRTLLLEHSVPLILGLPLLGLLLSFAVSQGLQPLQQLTRLLGSRAAGNRQPVELADAPSELAPLIDTLNQQFERLEDALERERRFNADVAHELRTPLAATMILLESAVQNRDHAVAEAAMVKAQASLSRLARRVEQILALARLDMGAATHASGPCDIAAIVKSCIEELAPQIADKDVAFGFVHDGTPAVIDGHEASLSAMFRNLIENALRYVDLRGSVEVTLAADAEAVRVEVVDDGPGIPADKRERVFARFHREHADRGDGYGLGLSIVRQAARRHGAAIVLSDPPAGSGLRVQVSLPRVLSGR